jgi:hypothetical protein
MAITITSTELKKLVEAVKSCIIERPTDLKQLNSSLEGLLFFLTTPTGRTKENCKEADLYFLLDDDHGFNFDHLPEDYQLILNDIGGQLHDTIKHSQIAENFESTPEQLLERIRKLRAKNG